MCCRGDTFARMGRTVAAQGFSYLLTLILSSTNGGEASLALVVEGEGQGEGDTD